MAIDKINSFKTIEEVENYRAEINESCDKRAEFIELCSKANELSEKPFGYIKESFESLSPELFKSSVGKSILNRYSKMIRENKNLHALHTIYENIRKANKESDIDFFVNSLANTNWDVDKKTLREDCKSLGRILAEGFLHLGKNAEFLLPEENSSLSSAVSYIAENKKTSKNIAEYSNAIKIIRESVEKNVPSEFIVENNNLDGLAERLIKEFNAKYSEDISKEEASVLKEVCSSNDREAVFNKYKKSCISKISEAKSNFDLKGDKSSASRLATVLEQVSNKSFSLDTVGSDICSLIELSNIFE